VPGSILTEEVVQQTVINGKNDPKRFEKVTELSKHIKKVQNCSCPKCEAAIAFPLKKVINNDESMICKAKNVSSSTG
jgi:hypothetical protein